MSLDILTSSRISFVSGSPSHVFNNGGHGYSYSSGSIYLILSLLLKHGKCFFTSAGISPFPDNFIPLSPFETLLLGMVLLQIFVFQLYGLVPFDLNKILHGDFSGMGFTKTVRKKRTIENGNDENEKLELADKILNIILLVDHYDCIPRTLCEVQKHAKFRYQPSALFIAILHIFYFSNTQRMKNEQFTGQASQLFEDAIIHGKNSALIGLNSTICENKYNSCPLTTLDIMNYIGDLHVDIFV